MKIGHFCQSEAYAKIFGESQFHQPIALIHRDGQLVLPFLFRHHRWLHQGNDSAHWNIRAFLVRVREQKQCGQVDRVLHVGQFPDGKGSSIGGLFGRELLHDDTDCRPFRLVIDLCAKGGQLREFAEPFLSHVGLNKKIHHNQSINQSINRPIDYWENQTAINQSINQRKKLQTENNEFQIFSPKSNTESNLPLRPRSE